MRRAEQDQILRPRLKEETEKKKKPPSDFSDEYIGKKIRIILNNGVVEGTLEKATKYWFKINKNNKYVYINKGWIVYIEPL
ncbi:MAG: hypothetical protein QXX88_00325 [Metallosphaera sp.]